MISKKNSILNRLYSLIFRYRVRIDCSNDKWQYYAEKRTGTKWLGLRYSVSGIGYDAESNCWTVFDSVEGAKGAIETYKKTVHPQKNLIIYI